MEHFMSNLVMLAASVFEIACGKTDRDRQTNAGETPTPSRNFRRHGLLIMTITLPFVITAAAKMPELSGSTK